MEHSAVIQDVHFSPLYVVPSEISLRVDIPRLNTSATLRASGSIDDLSTKYGFAVEGNNYDLRGIKGRRCWVRETADGSFEFVGYIQD